MVKIVPAILEKNFQEIQKRVDEVRFFAEYVQVDIVDGVFAPNQSFPYAHDGLQEVRLLDALKIPYELDLMVAQTERHLSIFLATNAKRVCVHAAATRDIHGCIRKSKEAGKEVYVAVTTDDTAETLQPFLGDVDGIQCMGIAHVGSQGQPYDKRIEHTIQQLRSSTQLSISVDGAVSRHTLPTLAALGVNQVCVGSALFDGEVAANLRALQEGASN